MEIDYRIVKAVAAEGFDFDENQVPRGGSRPNDDHGHRMGISAEGLYTKHGLGELPRRNNGTRLKAVAQRLGGDDDDHGHLILHEIRKHGISNPNKWDYGVLMMAEAWVRAWGWDDDGPTQRA